MPLDLVGEIGKMGGVLKPRFELGALDEDGRDPFRDALVGWFARHGKDYPWRRTREPYKVLISEVMLQQTQIASVLGKGYYTRFLEKFPNIQSLADAGDAELLKAWEGLGYYRRVRMLRETARAVILEHAGNFPQDVKALMKLPGIGRYTAGALRAFAFGLPAVLVDGNVARVLARLMDFVGPVDETGGQQQIWAWAEQLADAARPMDYHAGLMELGQSICRPSMADCLNCPVARFCQATEPERLPIKIRKISVTPVDEFAVWLRDGQGRLLLHHEAGARRTGLWKLPTREAEEINHLPLLAEHRYAITRYRVHLRVYDGRALPESLRMRPGDAWKFPDEVESLAMAAPFRRVVRSLMVDF